MAKSMTMSKITGDQIERAVDKLRIAMITHRNKCGSGAFQFALGMNNIGMEMLAVPRNYAEAFGDMIVRRAENVNRRCTPKKVLEMTRRDHYVFDLDDAVVATMPHGKGDAVDLHFFKLDRSDHRCLIPSDDLENEFALRELTPDPYAQSYVNKTDPGFADKHPNVTQWKDDDGNWCSLSFYQPESGGDRFVKVDRHVHSHGFGDHFWFAGCRE